MLVRPALVNVMFKAAEKAAKVLVHDFGEVENLQVSRKGPADFVSNADMSAQKILRHELSLARPEFGFLNEEKDGFDDTSNKPDRWIIDPLDGTTNFLHGMGHWAISIAAQRNGELVAGLVFDPIKNESFWAEKGVGAWSSRKRLRVSGRRDFADCLIGTGAPFKGVMHKRPNFSRQLNAIMPQVAGIRRCGSAALDLAYVAAGRFDAFWEEGISPWDCAAGIVLVREAGGFVTGIDPKENPLMSGNIIATNAELQESFTKVIRDASLAAK